jgi:hypothetical protein
MKILKLLMLCALMIVSTLSFAKENALRLNFNNQFYNLSTLSTVGTSIKTNLPMVSAYVIRFHRGIQAVHGPSGSTPAYADYKAYITIHADDSGSAVTVPGNFWISLTINTFPSISYPPTTHTFSISTGQVRGTDTIVSSENDPLDAAWVVGYSQSTSSYGGISVYPTTTVYSY